MLSPCAEGMKKDDVKAIYNVRCFFRCFLVIRGFQRPAFRDPFSIQFLEGNLKVRWGTGVARITASCTFFFFSFERLMGISEGIRTRKTL